MSLNKLLELRDEMLQSVPSEGSFFDVIPGLSLHRRECRTRCEIENYRPRVVIVVQGHKTAKIDGIHQSLYCAGDCLAAGFELPDGDHFLEGSKEVPYLCISYELNEDLVQEMLIKMGAHIEDKLVSDVSEKASNELLDAFRRLLIAMRSPTERKFLIPILEEEIHFRVLSGSLGSFFRQVYTPERPYARVMKAIDFIRKNYDRRHNIETLSELACMSPTSFHRHFKAFTGISPKQFQKVLRLKEAQRLISEEKFSCRKAALLVGYENQSQFNREFKAFFGRTPANPIRT